MANKAQKINDFHEKLLKDKILIYINNETKHPDSIIVKLTC